jgi:hypothetical protein
MAIQVNSSVTLDEGEELQTLLTTDDGNDVAYGDLPSLFYDKLFGNAAGQLNLSTAFPDAIGVGESADDMLTVTGSGTLSDVQFHDSAGGALDGDDSGLWTLGDRKIFLYADSDNPNIVYGREGTAGGTADSSGTIVLALYLEVSGDSSSAKVWSVLFEALRHPDDSSADDTVDLDGNITVGAVSNETYSFAGAPAGQNLFMAFASSTNPTNAIVVTGRDPANQSEGELLSQGDTVNTGKGGGATTLGTNDQGIKPNNGMYFTFVTDMPATHLAPATGDGLDQNEADVEANIDFTGLQTATSAYFSVVQISGNSTADIRLTAFSTELETGTAFVDGLTDDTLIDISRIKVELGGVDITQTITVEGLAANGAVVLRGVPVDAVVTYVTTDTHNRVLIENAKTNVNDKSFDIGSFGVVNTQNFSSTVGSFIKFDDDGPSLALPQSPDGGDLYVSNLVNGTDSDTVDFSKGSDLEGASFRITDAPGDEGDTTSGWDYYDVDGDGTAGPNEIRGHFGEGGVYELIVDQDTGEYTIEVTAVATAEPEHLDTADIKAGGPGTNWIDVGLTGDSSCRIAGYYNGDPAAINESNLNVGVVNGNLDAGESLEIKVVTQELTPGTNGDETLEDISAINIGTKTPKTTLYSYELYNDGVKVFDSDDVSPNGVSVGKNGTIRLYDMDDGDMFDTAVVTALNANAVKIGLRDITIEREVPDETLNFSFDLIDGDDDVAGPVEFSVFIDGNNDSVYPAGLLAPMMDTLNPDQLLALQPIV